jgi:hypothetical protein
MNRLRLFAFAGLGLLGMSYGAAEASWHGRPACAPVVTCAPAPVVACAPALVVACAPAPVVSYYPGFRLSYYNRFCPRAWVGYHRVCR